MDTTPEYIKMCKRASREITEPISVLNLETKEDYYGYRAQILYCKEHRRFIDYDYTNCPVCGEDDLCEEHWMRLPHQDELQEMIGQYYAEQDEMVFSSHYIKVAFLDFVAWMGIQYHPEPFVCVPTNCFDSGEQLWLAFVVKEKYGKVWKGEEWIKEKK